MEPIPSRREQMTVELERLGERYHVGLGVLPDPQRASPTICEVFITGPLIGTEMWALCQEVARDISRDLQSGLKPEAIAQRAERGPDGPVSIYGAVADLIVEEQARL